MSSCSIFTFYFLFSEEMLERILFLVCLSSALAEQLCTPGKWPIYITFLTFGYIFCIHLHCISAKIQSANAGIVTVKPPVWLFFFVASQVWNVVSNLKQSRIRHITQMFASWQWPPCDINSYSKIHAGLYARLSTTLWGNNWWSVHEKNSWSKSVLSI